MKNKQLLKDIITKKELKELNKNLNLLKKDSLKTFYQIRNFLDIVENFNNRLNTTIKVAEEIIKKKSYSIVSK